MKKETNKDIIEETLENKIITTIMPEIKERVLKEENDIYIPSCQYFDYKEGDDLEEAIEDIINKTNLKNYIKLTE